MELGELKDAFMDYCVVKQRLKKNSEVDNKVSKRHLI